MEAVKSGETTPSKKYRGKKNRRRKAKGKGEKKAVAEGESPKKKLLPQIKGKKAAAGKDAQNQPKNKEHSPQQQKKRKGRYKNVKLGTRVRRFCKKTREEKELVAKFGEKGKELVNNIRFKEYYKSFIKISIGQYGERNYSLIKKPKTKAENAPKKEKTPENNVGVKRAPEKKETGKKKKKKVKRSVQIRNSFRNAVRAGKLKIGCSLEQAVAVVKETLDGDFTAEDRKALLSHFSYEFFQPEYPVILENLQRGLETKDLILLVKAGKFVRHPDKRKCIVNFSSQEEATSCVKRLNNHVMTGANGKQYFLGCRFDDRFVLDTKETGV